MNSHVGRRWLVPRWVCAEDLRAPGLLDRSCAGVSDRRARGTMDCGNESPPIPGRPTRMLDPSTSGMGMAISTTQVPHRPMNLRGWLTLMVIYAVGGAILGSPGRGPVSQEDTSWQKWAAIVAPWF